MIARLRGFTTAVRALRGAKAVETVPAAAGARQSRAAHGEAAPVINPATLADLEGLGSSPAFIDKLIGVFVADNVTLMAKMESALGARNVAEFRSHLHAIKGSATSMGAERLTGYCRDLGRRSDAEIRLQIPSILKRMRDELAGIRESLERYLQERRNSTGQA